MSIDIMVMNNQGMSRNGLCKKLKIKDGRLILNKKQSQVKYVTETNLSAQ